MSLDLIVGAALYCCRPFFQTVCGAGLEGLALSSGETEMDEEIDLLRKTDPPRLVPGVDVAVGEMESEAWSQDFKRNLRVLHGQRRYEAPAWKHEHKQRRVITSIPVQILAAGQGWKVGRSSYDSPNSLLSTAAIDRAWGRLGPRRRGAHRRSATDVGPVLAGRNKHKCPPPRPSGG